MRSYSPQLGSYLKFDGDEFYGWPIMDSFQAQGNTEIGMSIPETSRRLEKMRVWYRREHRLKRAIASPRVLVFHAEWLHDDDIWRRVEWFAGWLSVKDIKATFFVYPFRARVAGRDIAGRVRALGLLGHEVGQHTHFYNGTKIEKPKKTVDLSELNIVHCLRRDFETLAQMGSLPKGFTAGSWTVDERVLDILADLRFDYDCSAQFPKPNEMTQANSYSWLRSPYIHSNSRGHVLCLPTTCSLGEWFKWGRRVRTGGMIPYQLVYLHDYDLRSFRNRRLLSYFVKISGKGTLRPLTAIAQEYRRKEVDGVGPCE